MGRTADDLLDGVLTLGQARQLGIGRRQLRTPKWRHVQYNRYRWAELERDELLPLAILLDRLPEGSLLSGLTAARLHGLDLATPKLPEVTVRPDIGIAARARATVRRFVLEPEDATEARGLPVTTALRTCFDLAGRLPLVEGVVIADMALHAGLFDRETWHAYVTAHRGRKGVAGSRRTLEHVESKAESPMESRLRMILVLGGLPRPQAQVSLFDDAGVFVGRPDLYYPDARLGIEYDGQNHRDRIPADNQRQNRLHQIGVSLLRYTAVDLAERRTAIVAEVRAALSPKSHRRRGHL